MLPLSPCSEPRSEEGRVLRSACVAPGDESHLVLTSRLSSRLRVSPRLRQLPRGILFLRKVFAFALWLTAFFRSPSCSSESSSLQLSPLPGREKLKLLQSVTPESDSPILHWAGSWASYEILLYGAIIIGSSRGCSEN